VQTLQTIPGLGEKKARKLMENPDLNNLSDIAKASIVDLTKAVDTSTAKAVYGFFNMPTE
jgi:excinuclease UvrABC nuclease subunit